MVGSNLVLSEAPYYGVQGEGIHVGHRMLFVRTQGCDVGCNYCDSMYTWPKSSNYTITTENLAIKIISSPSKLTRVWLTGGEPTIYSKELTELCKSTQSKRRGDQHVDFYLCTAGTILDEDLVNELHRVTLDIKPPSAEAKSISIDRIREWIDIARYRLEFKAAISPNLSDIGYIREILNEVYLPRGTQFTIQPQMVNEREVRTGIAQTETKWELDKFVEAVSDLQKDFDTVRVGYQMHKLFYPDKTRGI